MYSSLGLGRKQAAFVYLSARDKLRRKVLKKNTIPLAFDVNAEIHVCSSQIMSDAKHLLVHSFIFVGPSFSSWRSAYHRVKSLFIELVPHRGYLTFSV